MLTTKKCRDCGETKPWDDDPAIRHRKASGFHGARCRDCFVVFQRAVSQQSNSKLVPCTKTGEVVTRKVAANRRHRADPMNKVAHNIRSLTGRAFIKKGYTKDSSTAEILGCSFEELDAHMQDLFKPGMTWDNIGKEWHFDHHLPLSAATSLEEVVALSHYTNLVPLWKSENLSKGGKCDPEEVRAYLDLVKRGA